MGVFQGLIGIAGLIALACALSENRRAFSWRTPGLGLAVPVPLALLLIKRAGPSTRDWFEKAFGAGRPGRITISVAPRPLPLWGERLHYTSNDRQW